MVFVNVWQDICRYEATRHALNVILNAWLVHLLHLIALVVIQLNELTSIMAALANAFVTMVHNNLQLYRVYVFLVYVVMVLSN
jgi:hypothetical protein